jgi:hypothetical protein
MRTAAEILREFGLPPPPSGEDRYYTRCPKCSAGRARAHQHVKCLGITIGDNGAHFGCNHCGWKDGGYFNGKTNGHARSDSDRFVAVYDYTDENGGLLFQVCRKAGKQFPQRRPNGRGGWIWNTADVRKVLYRLPELTEAIATERTVLIVEGEKDVESLRKLNVPATCNPGGASGFAVIEDAENEGRILLLHAKNNMAPKPQGLAYRLVQRIIEGEGEGIVASYIAFDSEPVAVSADEALRANDGGGDPTAKADAKEFLQGALAAGAVPAAEVNRMARDHGLTTKAVRSAREALGVQIERDGFGPGSKSLWSLPKGPILAQPSHTCPTKDWASMESEGKYGTPKRALPAAPPCPPAKAGTAGNLWNDDPQLARGIPDFPLRALPVAESVPNDRAPALGPPGDSLDDFK